MGKLSSRRISLLTIYGNPKPDWLMGIQNALSWKGFTLSGFIIKIALYIRVNLMRLWLLFNGIKIYRSRNSVAFRQNR